MVISSKWRGARRRPAPGWREASSPHRLKTLTRNTVCGLGIRLWSVILNRALYLKRDLKFRRFLSTQRKNIYSTRVPVGGPKLDFSPNNRPFPSFARPAFSSLSFFPSLSLSFSFYSRMFRMKKSSTPNLNCVATRRTTGVKVRRRGRGRVEKWWNVIGCRVW